MACEKRGDDRRHSLELTPEQRGILATLSRETGKSIPALLDEALAASQEGKTPEAKHGAVPTFPRHKPLGEIAAELFGEIPDEELARLPIDGAPSMTITSMVCLNVHHEPLFCGYVLLDCALPSPRSMAYTGAGL